MYPAFFITTNYPAGRPLMLKERRARFLPRISDSKRSASSPCSIVGNPWMVFITNAASVIFPLLWLLFRLLLSVCILKIRKTLSVCLSGCFLCLCDLSIQRWSESSRSSSSSSSFNLCSGLSNDKWAQWGKADKDWLEEKDVIFHKLATSMS